MKKIVVILLLILPFVLIYSISFTGKILSEYTHIYVERLALVDEEENELSAGHVITLGRGETYTMNVKVWPELASNQTFTISNSDKTVCEIDEKTNVITALDYGTSDVVLTSKDRPISYAFRVRVFDEDIQEIQVDKKELVLNEGQKETINTVIIPSTTLPENRNLVYESDDKDVATVNANGEVTARSPGVATITIRSDHREEVFATVEVIVLEVVIDPVVAFDINGTYVTAEPTLDLRALTIINAPEYTNLKYTVKSGMNNVDQSRISEGVVTFVKRGVCKIEVSLVYKGETYTAAMTAIFQPEEEIQSITLSKTETELIIGKTEKIEVAISPSTTLPENKGLVYESADKTVATVNADGVITAVGEGETTITVRSDYKPNVFATITVTVNKIPVVSFSADGTYVTAEPTLDLNNLKVITVADYTDLKYTVKTNATNVDVSQIENGIVTFLQNGVYTIEVSLVYQGETYTATLTVLYQNN